MLKVNKPPHRLWLLFTVAITAAYLANCFTPLRLTSDTIRYFELAERLRGVWPSNLPIRNEFLPFGYPALLAALTSLHVPISFAVCLINGLYLSGAIYFTIRMFRRSVAPIYLAVLILLNWVTVKLFVLPLSEMQFLFFTIGSLWYFQSYTSTNKFTHLLLCVTFCAISILTRTAGIALLAALLISFILMYRHMVVGWIRSRRMYFVIVLTVVVVSLYWLFSLPKFLIYLNFITAPLVKGPLSFIGSNIYYHLINWGEIFMNIPFSKASNFIFWPFVATLYFFIGILSLFFTLRLLFKKNIVIPIHLKVFFLFYLLLLFCWPYYEPRFCFPLLPLIGGVLLQYKINARPFFKKLFSVYGFAYLLIGLSALGYYTQLSFNKEELARKQENGQFKKEYEKHFFNQQPSDTIINQKALYILNKYD